MIKSIEDYGKYVEELAIKDPDKARRWLLLGYRLFGLKLKFFPNKDLPSAKQKSAIYLNNTIKKVFTEPNNLALVNIFMPCEILEAMDIVPMCAELFSGFINGSHCESVFADEAKKEGIAETYCSYHKIFLGTAYTKLMQPPKAIINTSMVCDANNLTFRELASELNIPHYYVDVPGEKSEESIIYVADQLRDVGRMLENITGKKLDANRLKAAVTRSIETISLYRKVLDKKRDLYLPSDVTSEMYEAYLLHNGLGTEMSYDYVKTFLKDFERAEKFEGIKILWLHVIPNWQKPVTELFNFNKDCQIVISDMNFENFVEMDGNKPYESMAKRLVYSNWNSGQDRIDTALKMGKYLNIDGVVCFGQWGCKQTLGLADLFKEAFEIEGIPLLVLEGDGADRRNSSDGQVSTRLSAFIEMVKGRKDGK